jgi:hypothetical protein
MVCGALAALLAVVAVMVTIAATVTLANMLVDLLTPVAGRVLAGAIVAIGLLIVGAVLGLWIKSLIHSKELGSRTKSHAKVIWSALNEPY